MDMNVGKEVAALCRLSVNELKERYAEVFGEPTASRHKQWLVKRVIWRIQSLAEGDLTERARRRAAELANDADLRRKAPKSPPSAADDTTRTRTRHLPNNGDQRVPLPGSVITRVYKGEMLHIQVLPSGFEFEGEIYKSLSAVAKKISGTHCNGYHFFRLAKEGSVPNE